MKSPVTRSRGLAIATVAAFAVALVPVGAATAAPAAKCDNRTNNTISKLLECVDADGAMEHLEAFQAIADENDGNRAAGTSGYEASVDYVVETLEAAGWNVSIDEFDFTYVGPSTLTQLTPVQAVDYPTGPFTGSGSGDVTAARDRRSTCSSASANTQHQRLRGRRLRRLIPGRHTSRSSSAARATFGDKAINAEEAGAAASSSSTRATPPRLIARTSSSARSAVHDGRRHPRRRRELSSRASRSRRPARRPTSWCPLPEQRPQKNVIAELPGTNDDNVVMAGAHLDSVQAGPGINDNGSGSASLLELAQQMSKVKPENTVRLAWWGAEEAGLLGSQAYVDGLSQAEKDRIALYLNFDMVASPNYIFMIYDGDESQFPAPVEVPEGSVADRGPLRELLHERGRAVRRRRVQRSQRLRGLHPRGDSGRWPVHGRRGREDRRAAGDLGWHRG